MANTNQTIVQKGHGHYEEGVLTGTGYDPAPYAYPGMAVKLDSDGEFSLGCGANDGNRDLVRIVVEDNLLGKTVEDEYNDGARFRYYIPLPGDELLVYVTSGETLVRGDLLICDTSTGEWIKTTGSPEMEPFQALEPTLTNAGVAGALQSDALILVKRV